MSGCMVPTPAYLQKRQELYSDVSQINDYHDS